MGENDHPKSFGRYLRSVRSEKGISLEQVSWETQIGVDTLQQIESEDIAGLPAEVFVKGFIRAYAKVVGADGDRAVQSYAGSLGVHQRSARSEADLNLYSKRFWPHLLMSMGLIVGLMALSIFAMSLFRDPSMKKPAAPETQTAETAIGESTPASDTQASEPESMQSPVEPSPAPGPSEAVTPPLAEAMAAPVPEPAEASQPYLLNIRANEETWLKVIVDDNAPSEYILGPGDRLALRAVQGYSLLIGNAGGVEMDLNGEPVSLRGKSGQVRTIELP
ncbi:hypothetical protein D3OALGA1CA_577 [Olavius algarvensis associated proteobacterium Delta 3]|nr:hypothetical protein D3OALGA1CA_577 [Olavius algarvensis associated proteobacterium Delta 3]